jgi:hypothetical protein
MSAGLLAQALYDLPVFVGEEAGDIPMVIQHAGNPQREANAPGSQRGAKADLVFDFSLSREQAGVMAIEMKVDSAGSHDQLRKTAGSDADAVLLALGLAGYRLSRFDTEVVNREDGRAWRFADVVAWHRILNDVIGDVPDLPPFIVDYLAELSDQAHRHAEAGERARRGEDSRGNGFWQLDHCAWLAAVREELDDRDAEWALDRQISGELMHNAFPGRWRHGSGADLYLQFDGNWEGRRTMALRVGSTTAEAITGLRADAAFQAAAREIGMQPAAGSVAHNWRSAPVSVAVLTGARPDHAAEVARRGITVLEAAAIDALDRAV